MCTRKFHEELLLEVRESGSEDYEVSLVQVEKNNGIHLPAIRIRHVEEEVAPTIYLDYYEDEHRSGVSIRHLARQIWEQYEEVRPKAILPDGFFRSYETVRSRIFCRLINYERNRDLLLKIPHECWQDLAITYYYQMDPEVLSDATILIRREHLLRWGITEEELRADAWENSRSLLPSQFDPLDKVLERLWADGDEEEREGTALSVLSNEKHCLGAVCICYPGETERIAEALDTDYYILPSSIHECLILPDDGMIEREQLDRMVREINRRELHPQDILSDRVYRYSRAEQALA